MHVDNNLYYIILGNHSRSSWPIFNLFDIFIKRFQFLHENQNNYLNLFAKEEAWNIAFQDTVGIVA